MAREFSEELLGTPEDYGTGPLDYPGWPLFGQLCAARDAGLLGVWCLGLGADPLTLATDILAAAVFAGDAFDALFGGLVAANDEGRVVSWPGLTGVPFTADVVARFARRLGADAARPAPPFWSWPGGTGRGCSAERQGPGPRPSSGVAQLLGAGSRTRVARLDGRLALELGVDLGAEHDPMPVR